MSLPEEPPAAEPDEAGDLGTRGWNYLALGMAFFGAIFLGLGAVGLAGTCCSAGMAWLLVPSHQAPALVWVVAALGWSLVPLTVGILLLRAMGRVGQPVHDSGTFLVVVAAATFVGLAWVAGTAAVFFGGGLR
jgi:CubicO group peptidase (beta-lactamase class C family)